ILAASTAVLALGAVAAVLVTTASGSKSASKATLTLYSGQHPQTVNAIVDAFEKATGISVAVRQDDEGVLAAQMIQEGSHSPADVFMTENSPALEALGTRGMLAKVAPSTLAKTSANYTS